MATLNAVAAISRRRPKRAWANDPAIQTTEAGNATAAQLPLARLRKACTIMIVSGGRIKASR